MGGTLTPFLLAIQALYLSLEESRSTVAVQFDP